MAATSAATSTRKPSRARGLVVEEPATESTRDLAGALPRTLRNGESCGWNSAIPGMADPAPRRCGLGFGPWERGQREEPR